MDPERKKIFILIGDFRLAGAEVVGVNLANAFAEEGHVVSIICLRSRGGLFPRVHTSINIISLECRIFEALVKLRHVLKKAGRQSVLISTIRNLNILCSISALGLNRRPEMLFREANTYRQLAGSGYRGRILAKFYKYLIPWSYKTATIVIANSYDTSDDLCGLLRKSERQKISVIGNPVLSSAWLKDRKLVSTRVAKNDGESIVKIISVGRLHEQKDYYLALEVFAILKSNFFPCATYEIVGEGNLLRPLEEKAKSLSLRIGSDIVFLGASDDLKENYESADVFLLTSKWEGFGNVLVEAMYFGVPPVAAECPGGPKDILPETVGGYVRSRNPTDLCNAIVHRLRHPVNPDILRQRALAYESREIARKYMRAGNFE